MNKRLKLILVVLPLLIISFFTIFPKPVEGAVQQLQQVIKVFVTNWPDVQKVREQNLDANGNIKVHEQGTANVNLVNNTPIPVINVTPSPVAQEWEYTTECFSNWNTYSSGLPQRLNDKAIDGWELVSTLQFQEQLACEYYKRAK